MTFIVDQLEEFIEQYEKEIATCDIVVRPYKIAYLDGFKMAKQMTIRAEAELKQRIWTAWVEAGVEPR